MSAFELTLPPSPAWVDLARDLVATGARSVDLSLDRFHDLLVLTDQVCSEALLRPDIGGIEMGLTVDDGVLELQCAVTATSNGLDVISDLALSVIADEHWHTVTDTGFLIGFRIGG